MHFGLTSQLLFLIIFMSLLNGICCTQFVVDTTYPSNNCSGTPVSVIALGSGCVNTQGANTSYYFSCINNLPFSRVFQGANCQGSGTTSQYEQTCTGSSGTSLATCSSSFPNNTLLYETFSSTDCSGEWTTAMWTVLGMCVDGNIMYSCMNGIPTATDCNGKGGEAISLQCSKAPGSPGSQKYFNPCSGGHIPSDAGMEYDYL